MIQQMTKTKFVPKEPNWNDKSDNELECIICLEIKKDSSISSCCINIICNDCTKNLNGTCPLRCKKLSAQFKASIKLNKRINKVFSLCDVCFAEVHPWDMDRHQETCGDHIVGESVKDSCLHNCTLIRKTTGKQWKCYSRENAYQVHKDKKTDSCYECEKCQIKFCTFCVAKAVLLGNNMDLNGKVLSPAESVFFPCKNSEDLTVEEIVAPIPSFNYVFLPV
ncbi:unnamed protein product [Moneuplotes crassus]|uniref:Uncharacterized protein n=1 Tax=Euplotes crassus TaxID=5936 RepID=A0AAD2D063_EUPCR|nr:unnamed protein product [Moneuplotes crassus]